MQLANDRSLIIHPSHGVKFSLPGVQKSNVLLKEVKESCVGRNRRIEAFSGLRHTKVGGRNMCCNGFLRGVHLAFSNHLPLVLSPDSLWTLIMTGVSQHIKHNAETLRSVLVQHKKKKTLVVEDNNLVMGESTPRDWELVTQMIFEELQKDVTHPSLVSLGLCNFSTSTPTEKIVSQMVLFDALSPFYSYSLLTLCGIPEIRLSGTRHDWQVILDRIASLNSIGLEWWTPALCRIIKMFLRRFDERELSENDVTFWKSMYKYNDHCGGPYVHGWVTALFPYIHNGENDAALVRNDHMIEYWMRDFEFAEAVSDVPFIWNYLGEDFDMRMVAGFTGATQDRTTGEIHCEMAWAITHQDGCN